jgi:CBS domain-containing protein
VSTSTTELTVAEVMRSIAAVPVVRPTDYLKIALEAMNAHRLGLACLLDEDDRLVGIVTDGDVRRMVLRAQKPMAALLIDDVLVHATVDPTVIRPETPLVDAVRLMEGIEVWDLPVVDDTGVLRGVLHLHPVVKVLLADIGA